MIIYLMRHGQTTGDVEDRYGGDYDDSLTPFGREQVENRAKTFVDKNIKIIFASSKKRAQESAKIISKVLGVPVETVPEWRERNFYGILTGMKKSEAKLQHPELVKFLESYKNTIPNGETYDEFKARISKAMQHVLDSPYDTVLIIAHGGPISCTARELLKIGEFKKLGDCAVLKIKADNGKLLLESMDGAEIK